MSNNQEKSVEAQSKPAFSWESDDNEAGDFLADIVGQAAPKACSIDEPDCEACQ